MTRRVTRLRGAAGGAAGDAAGDTAGDAADLWWFSERGRVSLEIDMPPG